MHTRTLLKVLYFSVEKKVLCTAIAFACWGSFVIVNISEGWKKM
jgi:hypothetical protein